MSTSTKTKPFAPLTYAETLALVQATRGEMTEHEAHIDHTIHHQNDQILSGGEWFGMVHSGNVVALAQRLRRTLHGRRWTWIAENTAYRDVTVRASEYLKADTRNIWTDRFPSPIRVDYAESTGVAQGLTVSDSYGIWWINGRVSPAEALTYEIGYDESGRWGSDYVHLASEWTDTPTIRVHKHNGTLENGEPWSIRWTIAPEKPYWADPAHGGPSPTYYPADLLGMYQYRGERRKGRS